MSDINKFLMELRKRRGLTLREAAERSGLSHSYISSLENGKHPRTKAPIIPSPESLRGLSKAYNYPYEELMVIAGHMKEVKNTKESANALPESIYDEIIKETEERYNVNLRDDPFVLETMKQIIDSYAKSKQNR